MKNLFKLASVALLFSTSANAGEPFGGYTADDNDALKIVMNFDTDGEFCEISAAFPIDKWECETFIKKTEGEAFPDKPMTSPGDYPLNGGSVVTKHSKKMYKVKCVCRKGGKPKEGKNSAEFEASTGGAAAGFCKMRQDGMNDADEVKCEDNKDGEKPKPTPAPAPGGLDDPDK